MGKKRAGSWRIEKDQLCTDYGKELEVVAMKFGCLERTSS
jgi:hypothetical protein